MDQDKVNELLGQFVSDLSATEAAGLTVIGQKPQISGRSYGPSTREPARLFRPREDGAKAASTALQ